LPNRRGSRPHSVPLKKRRRLFGGVVFLFIIAIALAVVFFTPLLDLSNHHLYGNSTVTAEEIWQASGFTTRIERTSGLRSYPNFFSVSASRMERNILSIPYIYTAEVIKSFPNTITIHVTERIPAGYVIFQDMMFIYIDRHGMALEMRSYMSQILPVIVGLGIDSFTPGTYLEAANNQALAVAVELTQMIQERGMFIDEINTADPYNIRLFAENIEVIFGTMNRADEKLTHLNAILNDANRERGIRGTLDLTNPTGSYVFIPQR